jgi:hypothetical protein
MNNLKNADPDLKDKIELDHNLSISVFSEDGKTETKYDIIKNCDNTYKYEASKDDSCGGSTGDSDMKGHTNSNASLGSNGDDSCKKRSMQEDAQMSDVSPLRRARKDDDE